MSNWRDLIDPVQDDCDQCAQDAASAECIDCGTETNPIGPDQRSEMYMVHDDVWEAAGMTPNGGCLCIGCLEKRLGRQLRAGDFKDVPLNDLTNTDGERAFSWRTPRLVNRMTTL